MIIGVPKEIHPGERRVAIVPSTIGQLKKLGYEVIIEKGAGILANFPDNLYQDAGAEVIENAAEIWERSDLVMTRGLCIESKPVCNGQCETRKLHACNVINTSDLEIPNNLRLQTSRNLRFLGI